MRTLVLSDEDVGLSDEDVGFVQGRWLCPTGALALSDKDVGFVRRGRGLCSVRMLI